MDIHNRSDMVSATSRGVRDRQNQAGEPMASVYEQIGGAPAVEAAVDTFYRKVLADDRIARFFDDVDMERQATKQKAFLTMVMGGPAHYTGLDMRKGHLHLIARGMDD